MIDRGVLNDVEKAIEVPLGKRDYNHRKIYPNTNENMRALFDMFSVEGKDVFSVLASSDQVFSAFYLGAKNVDSFDSNKLTIYYYYLRKWIIKYLKEEYINEEYYNDGSELIDLIKTIKGKSLDEKKAQAFWISYLNKNKRIDKDLFITTSYSFDNVFKDDLDVLSKRIKNIKFYNYDLATRFKLKKKYDVVILSNILECLQNPCQLFAAKDNIERLLKDDGICVCSHLMKQSNSEPHLIEVELMTRGKLIEEELEKCYLKGKKTKEVGYVYKKGR